MQGMKRPSIVIFGAAVLKDGRASPSLSRRIGYGAKAAACCDAPIFCSGGVGRVGPSEASLIQAGLIAFGVSPDRLVLDEESLDTLQSVVAVARFVRRQRLDGVVVCSDGYHIPRIRMMLALLGVHSLAGPIARGLPGMRLCGWLKMHLREALAIAYDVAIVLAQRGQLLKMIAA